MRAIEVDGEGGIVGLTLRSGERLPADFVVSAVPFDRAPGLFDDETRKKLPMLIDVETIEPSPIIGVHLWLNRRICPFEFVAIVGKTIDWVFDHTRLQNRGGENGGQYLQIVISAARVGEAEQRRGRLDRLGRPALALAGVERRDARQIASRHRTRGHVRGLTGNRGIEARATDADRWSFPRGRVDRDRLAVDNGRGGSLGLSRRRRRPRRPRPSRNALATRLAERLLGSPPARRSFQPSTLLSAVVPVDDRENVGGERSIILRVLIPEREHSATIAWDDRRARRTGGRNRSSS